MNLPAPSTQEAIAHILDVLTFGDVEVAGRLVDARTLALLGRLTLGHISTPALSKPLEGWPPLL